MQYYEKVMEKKELGEPSLVERVVMRRQWEKCEENGVEYLVEMFVREEKYWEAEYMRRNFEKNEHLVEKNSELKELKVP